MSFILQVFTCVLCVARLINSLTPSQAPPLVPRKKKSVISLPIVRRHKHQRTEDRRDEAIASTPAPAKGKESKGTPIPLWSTDLSASGQAPGHQGVVGTTETVRTVSQTAGETPTSARARTRNFLVADSTTKLELIQDLAKSCNLAASGPSKPIRITKEEVMVAEVSGAYSPDFPPLLFFAFMLHPLLIWFCRLSFER